MYETSIDPRRITKVGPTASIDVTAKFFKMAIRLPDERNLSGTIDENIINSPSIAHIAGFPLINLQAEVSIGKVTAPLLRLPLKAPSPS
jgi:hypothetical protein